MPPPPQPALLPLTTLSDPPPADRAPAQNLVDESARPHTLAPTTRSAIPRPHRCSRSQIKRDRPGKGGGGGKAKGGRGRGAREDAGPYNRTGAKACNNCGQIGHLAGACPMPAQCHACGSEAHSVADCPNRDKTCDICGKVGHLKIKCRVAARAAEKAAGPGRSAPVSNKICNNCGVMGELHCWPPNHPTPKNRHLTPRALLPFRPPGGQLPGGAAVPRMRLDRSFRRQLPQQG